MKKTYIKPEIACVEIEMLQMIAYSENGKGDPGGGMGKKNFLLDDDEEDAEANDDESCYDTNEKAYNPW